MIAAVVILRYSQTQAAEVSYVTNAHAIALARMLRFGNLEYDEVVFIDPQTELEVNSSVGTNHDGVIAVTRTNAFGYQAERVHLGANLRTYFFSV